MRATVTPVMDPRLAQAVIEFREIEEQFEQAQKALTLARKKVARVAVVDVGMTHRQAAVTLGVSHQRIHQLVKD